MVNWPQRMCNRCHYPMMKAADERGEGGRGTFRDSDHCQSPPTKIFVDKTGQLETPLCDPHYDIVMAWAERTGHYQ